MTTPDYRALCADLADELDRYTQDLLDDNRLTHPLADRARDALKSPPLMQTKSELLRLIASEIYYDPSPEEILALFYKIINASPSPAADPQVPPAPEPGEHRISPAAAQQSP
jgi:hypothetical protein